MLPQTPQQAYQQQLLAQLGIQLWLPNGLAQFVAAPSAHNPTQPSPSSTIHPTQTSKDVVDSGIGSRVHAAEYAGITADTVIKTETETETDLDLVATDVTQTIITTQEQQPSTQQTSQIDDNFIEPVEVDHSHQTNAVDDANDDNIDNGKTIASFALQGLRYQQWLLLCDVEVLKQPEQAALWQSMQRGLNSQVLQLNFPLVEGMNKLSLARAALQGFLTKVANSNQANPQPSHIISYDNLNIGLLSSLSDELLLDEMQRLPYLAEMLENPLRKKQLWQIIHPV